MFPTSRMLEQFVVVAEERHVGRAAARLAMSQPPLTQAIQRLEGLLGVELLNRAGRGIQLTAAGAQFAVDARRLLATQRTVAERARRIADGLNGVVRVGFVAGLAYEYLPTLVRAFRERYADVGIELHQRPTYELGELVMSGDVDVALVREPLPSWPETRIQRLFMEPLGVAVPTGHIVGSLPRIGLNALASVPFAAPSSTALPGLHRLLYDACKAAGFVPVIEATADALTGLLALVATSNCVALVPREVRHGLPVGVDYRDLDGFGADLELSVVAVSRDAEMNPAVQRFLQFTVEQSSDFHS